MGAGGCREWKVRHSNINGVPGGGKRGERTGRGSSDLQRAES
jgi:hypothetical protein